jgi:hypothetical protein
MPVWHRNIAIVFGPNLIRPKVETVQNALEMPLLQGIVQILIEQADIVLERDSTKTLTRRESRRFAPSGRPLSMLFVGKDLLQIAQDEMSAELAADEATGLGVPPLALPGNISPGPQRTKRGSVRYRANQIQAMHKQHDDTAAAADGARGTRSFTRSKLATSPAPGAATFTTSPSANKINRVPQVSATLARADSPTTLAKKRLKPPKTAADVPSPKATTTIEISGGSSSSSPSPPTVQILHQPPHGPAPSPPAAVGTPPSTPAPAPPGAVTATVSSPSSSKSKSKSRRHFATDTL